MSIRTRIIIAAALGAFLLPYSALAATVHLAPSAPTIAIGGTSTVRVRVASTEQAMNAIDTAIAFPSDFLEVTNVSRAGSIVDFWVHDPSFSNTNGTARLEGIVLTPGFTGSSGHILSITFRAKRVGSAPITITSAAVLANDGLGTNILTGSSGTTIRITEQAPAAPPSVEVPMPTIGSPTHPNESVWYARPDVRLDLTIPDHVTALHGEFSDEPVSTPSAALDPETRTVTEQLPDGTHYYHVITQGPRGERATSCFRVNIDSTPPEQLDVRAVPSDDPTDPRPVFTISASDALSGIDHVLVSVDDRTPEPWADDGSGRYTARQLRSGAHRLIVTAVDRAGNETTVRVDFSIAYTTQFVFMAWAILILALALIATIITFIIFQRRKRLTTQFNILDEDRRLLDAITASQAALTELEHTIAQRTQGPYVDDATWEQLMLLLHRLHTTARLVNRLSNDAQNARRRARRNVDEGME
ncbi:MAG: cohesin domain-containing protein [Candidatus Uhrbacteria bacterium]